MGHYDRHLPLFLGTRVKHKETGEERWVRTEIEMRELVDTGEWRNADQPGRASTHNGRGEASRDDPRFSSKGKKILDERQVARICKLHTSGDASLVSDFMRDTDFLDTHSGSNWQVDNIKGDK